MKKSRKAFTLIELIVSVGLFALIMMLAAGAYLIIIGVGRTAQASATGINSLSFALEDMTRSVRTGTAYTCPGSSNNCTINGSVSPFSFIDSSGHAVSFALSGGAITQNSVPLTDSTVTITNLTFYVSGTARTPSDYNQPHVTFVISGTVSSGPGKTSTFSVETGATMRSIDI